MFNRLTRGRRKFVAAPLAVVAALAIAGAAFSYYGGSGTGSASAAAGHAPRTVTVSGVLDPASSPLYPGGGGDVNITITLTGNGGARVGAVSLDTTQGDEGISGLPVGCDRDWFQFAEPDPSEFPLGSNVTEGNPLEVVGGLSFIDAPVLQDACSDATFTLHLQATPS